MKRNTMPRQPSDVRDALLVFADVVESSKLSAYLGPLDYAQQILNFQNLFANLGRKYFPEEKDKSAEYSLITARGDEGLLFYVTDEIPKTDMIYMALEFVVELKGRLKMAVTLDENSDRPARGIELGAGIHYGPVALLTALKKDDKGRARSFIDGLEGYSINYAKRVESCSRQGSYSRVFLSKEAASVLDGDPIIFSKTMAPLKGIGENVEVFEIQSGYFHDIPISTELPEDESFINFLNELAENPEKIDEPWIKPLIVSVIDSRLKEIGDPAQKAIYQRRLTNLAWHRPSEDDPILLFIRAREYDKKNQQTARITYLKKILDRFPHFIPARKQLVDACWKITRQKTERSERIFARDTAKEFINKFPAYLSDSETRQFKSIVEAVQKKK